MCYCAVLRCVAVWLTLMGRVALPVFAVDCNGSWFVLSQVLLQEREQQQLAQQLQQGFDAADGAAAAADGDGDQQQQGKRESSPLRALILTPTRELALQV